MLIKIKRYLFMFVDTIFRVAMAIVLIVAISAALSTFVLVLQGHDLRASFGLNSIHLNLGAKRDQCREWRRLLESDQNFKISDESRKNCAAVEFPVTPRISHSAG